MTLVCRQFDEATLTRLALGTTYEANQEVGNLVNFFERLQYICYQNNDGGLSYNLYKGVIATKSLLNFTNRRPNDPHGYKEELKIKYSTTTAIIRKFLN